MDGKDAREAGSRRDNKTLVPCANNRILIADDEELVRRTFERIFAENLPELAVDSAPDGPKTVELFSCGHHGMILMDAHMPGMGGAKTYKTIEQICREKNWEIPSVIFWIGSQASRDMEIEKITLLNPKHKSFTKPLSMDVLVEAVRDRLRPASKDSNKTGTAG